MNKGVKNKGGAGDDSDDDSIAKVQNYKIILVGQSSCGKTSIINRYISNDFNENEKKTE